MIAADASPPPAVIIGHRCREYKGDWTNENTVAALRDTARVDRAWCEIDAWKLADGKVVVVHDRTWNRVVDPATMPPGMSLVVPESTWSQVRQLRTTGGKRIPTLKRMLNVADQLGVKVIVEIKNDLGDFSPYVPFFDRTWWYQQPRPAGGCGAVDGLRTLAEAGATVGIKTDDDCPMTPADVAAMGGSFIVTSAKRLKADDGAYIQECRDSRIKPLPYLVRKANALALRSLGVKRLIVPRPRIAQRWW